MFWNVKRIKGTDERSWCVRLSGTFVISFAAIILWIWIIKSAARTEKKRGGDLETSAVYEGYRAKVQIDAFLVSLPSNATTKRTENKCDSGQTNTGAHCACFCMTACTCQELLQQGQMVVDGYRSLDMTDGLCLKPVCGWGVCCTSAFGGVLQQKQEKGSSFFGGGGAGYPALNFGSFWRYTPLLDSLFSKLKKIKIFLF